MNKKLTKIMTLIMILTLAVGLLAGCVKVKQDEHNGEKDANTLSESKYPMTVVDGFGNEVTIEKLPTRIVSLAPSHTEILFSLGLGDRVVGVTSYCDYPEEAKSREKVGDAMSLNVEKIIELNPDLVIQYGQGNEEVNKKLKDAGICLLSYQSESVQEVIDLITKLGQITGAGRAATILTTEMQAKMDYIIYKVKDASKPKVFYEVWNEPLMTAGPGSFIDELITLAGGENIAKDAEGLYPQFQLEQLIERNPDVYLTAKDLPDKTVESIKSREGYEVINAIKEDRIYLLEPNIISRPGPRIIEGLELIAKCIHPELFQ